MGCAASNRGFATEKQKLPPNVRRVIRWLSKETLYPLDELERLWIEFGNLAEDGKNQEQLCYTFLVKHKLGHNLIFMIMDKEGMDPKNVVVRGHEQRRQGSEREGEGEDKQYRQLALVEELFPLCVKILSTLRKGSIAEQLQWYFHLFDINEDGELSPDEMGGMVKVLLENNPTMSDIVTSEGAIMKLVEEIFAVADDNGDGVLSLKEFLAHSQFITKKIILNSTSFQQRTKRLMRRMHGDSTNETSITRYSSPAAMELV